MTEDLVADLRKAHDEAGSMPQGTMDHETQWRPFAALYNAAGAMLDVLEGTLTEPEWRGVVLGRGNATDVDANWQLTVWDPTEIETARREFPKSEYKLARMILDESEVPDV